MAARKTHDAVYAGEKYTDREGNEKTRYVNMGVLFQREDGSLVAKIETIPVGFTGWVNFYEPRDQDGTKAERPQRAVRPQRTASPPAAGNADAFADDDIPF
jgi:single-stranded DNA-binding protein